MGFMTLGGGNINGCSDVNGFSCIILSIKIRVNRLVLVACKQYGGLTDDESISVVKIENVRFIIGLYRKDVNDKSRLG